MAESKQQQQQSESGSAEAFFGALIERVPGLWGVVASDRDGVVLAEAFSEERQGARLDPALAASFAVVLEQAGKLGLDANDTVTALYDGMVVVHINHLPLVVTLLGEESINAGALLSLGRDLREKLAHMRGSVMQE